MKRAAFALLWLLAAAGPASATFDDGIRAYRIRDYPAALKEFQASAANGNSEAQFYLGQMYVRGLGVNQSDTEAQRWFRSSAELGNGKAQFNLGLMYYSGQGIRKDMELAYFWFLLSIKTDNTEVHDLAVKNRDIIGKSLSKQQQADAEALVNVWRPKR